MESLKGWLPISIWQQDGEWWVDWCWFAQRKLDRSFFCDSVEEALRLPFNQAFRRQTPLSVLCEWPAADAAPVAFIHHASRCGSTLVCQMLAQLDEFIVLSEPPPLDALLRGDLDPATREAALRGLLAAYGQARRGGEKALVIKLDAWNIGELPLLHACFPQTPWLFIYRDPLEIAVSHLRSPGMHMVPGIIGASTLDGDDPGYRRESFIAGRLGRIFRQGLEHCRQLGGVPVNYTQLPGALDGPLGDLFGLSAEQRTQAFTVANRHAKQAGQAFVADSRGKRQEASALLEERVSEHVQAAYDALEQLREARGLTG